MPARARVLAPGGPGRERASRADGRDRSGRADHPTVFRTFEEDVGGGRAIAALRLGGAAVLIAGAGWLLVTTPTARAGAIALIALGVAAWWILAFARARRRRAPHVLRLTPDGIELDAARAPWADVREIVLDEERLVVRVERVAGEPLIVEPIWRGESVYALADAIRAARDEASRAADGPARSGGAPPAAPA